MMDLGTLIIGILLSAVALLLVGHSFIDSFFKLKVELLTKLYNHEKGDI